MNDISSQNTIKKIISSNEISRNIGVIVVSMIILQLTKDLQFYSWLHGYSF